MSSIVKANQWIHVLLPALLAALRALGDAPARSLTALAQRLGVAEADAASVVTPLEEEPAPVVTGPTAGQASPLLPMTGRNGASSAPRTLLNRKKVIAARKKDHTVKNALADPPARANASSPRMDLLLTTSAHTGIAFPRLHTVKKCRNDTRFGMKSRAQG